MYSVTRFRNCVKRGDYRASLAHAAQAEVLLVSEFAQSPQLFRKYQVQLESEKKLVDQIIEQLSVFESQPGSAKIGTAEPPQTAADVPDYAKPISRRSKRKPPLPKVFNKKTADLPSWANNKPQSSSKPKRNSKSSQRKNDDAEPSESASADKFIPKEHDEIPLAEYIESSLIEHTIDIAWDDVAELHDAKDLLHEAVVLPSWSPDLFQGIRRPWRGILMFGPPGTGKTMLAKAVAHECGTTFFNVSAATLTSKWRGESEKLVKTLFDMARFYAPSTLFFDEIDSLCGTRSDSDHEASRRVKSMLLTQMDGIGANNETSVVVLAATNTPWSLDEAFRRRLEKRIYIPLPDAKARETLFNIYLRNVILGENCDIPTLAGMTDGYSGADISIVCRDAAMMVFRRRMKNISREEMKAAIQSEETKNEIRNTPVRMEDFEKSISKINKSVSAKDLTRFVEWKNEFGSS